MFKRQFLLVCLSGLFALASSAPSTVRSSSLNKYLPARANRQHILPKGFGLAYGAYRQHESPDGLQPTEEEIREDLSLLKEILPEPRRIRVYSAIGPGGLAAIIASEEGFLVTLGAWIGPERTETEKKQNEKEVAELIRLAPFVHPELVIVGNETILRSDTTTDNLKNYIRRVKAALPGVMVSTAEPWATWVVDPRGKDLVDAVDILTVHVHPFWEKTPVEQAPEAVFQRLNEVRTKFGKQVILGETGWPSEGNPQDKAIPSPENQLAFIAELLRLAELQNSRIFLFEAFDEPFKGVVDRSSSTETAAEGPTGAHWGIFSWNRKLKPLLKDIFGNPSDPNPLSLIFRILTRGSLAPGLDYGVMTALEQRDWVTPLTPEESERPDKLSAFRMAFPSNQCWGSVFITTRKPTPVIQDRQTTNVGEYDRLAIDFRIVSGSDGIEIAPKTPEWPDDGTESKVVITGLSQQWKTVVIPLSLFSPTNLNQLYVVCGLNFFGMAGKSIDVAEIRYLPQGVPVASSLTAAPLSSRQNLDPYILKEGKLSCGYGLGVATSPPLVTDWLQAQPGFLRLSYPGDKDWGSAFFTVGNPPPPQGKKISTNFSGWPYLAIEARGESGGEVCEVGIRSVLTSSYQPSLALTRFELSQTWTWFFVPLTSVSAANLNRVDVVATIEFKGVLRRNINLRNIKLTAQTSFEADVAPRPNGNGSVSIADWVQIGRFAAGLDTIATSSEFQRADCAPKSTFGNGAITISDWVQAGRYATGLDSLTLTDGPASPASPPPTLATITQSQGGMPERQFVTARTIRVINPNIGYDQSDTLLIELDAHGNENALGFSINFDPQQYRFLSATTGYDAKNAIMNLNLDQVTGGSIGFALTLPSGKSFVAGLRQLVVLKLTPVSGQPLKSGSINFSDRPISRELVDVNANTLPAVFTFMTVRSPR